MTHEELAFHQAMIASRASRAVVESMDRARWDKSEADVGTVERFLAAINEQLQWISARMSGRQSCGTMMRANWMGKAVADAPDLLPCPHCGKRPDPHGKMTYQETDGPKWGSVVCGCTEVRTGYGPVETWREEAAAAWNARAPIIPSAAARVLLSDPEAMERMAAAIWNRSDDKIGWGKSKAMPHAADQVAWTREDVRSALRAIAGDYR